MPNLQTVIAKKTDYLTDATNPSLNAAGQSLIPFKKLYIKQTSCNQCT